MNIYHTLKLVKAHIRKRSFEDRLLNKGKLSDGQLSYVCDLINELKTED